jgi:uncharacterized RDD family membrane protein YckC
MATSQLAQQRIAAWLIDLVLVFGIGSLLSEIGWVASAAYWLLRDGLFEGQSIGKRVMELSVTTGPDRAPCTYPASAIRNILWLVPFINLIMGLTGLYYISRDRAGRHWGDRLADTRVVKAKGRA